MHARAQEIRREQCEAGKSIRKKYGLKSALDYLVSEKLLNFAEAAVSYREFAQELPFFVSEVRCVFTQQELTHYLVTLAHNRAETVGVEEDDFEPASIVEACMARLELIGQMLTNEHLGTS